MSEVRPWLQHGHEVDGVSLESISVSDIVQGQMILEIGVISIEGVPGHMVTNCYMAQRDGAHKHPEWVHYVVSGTSDV